MNSVFLDSLEDAGYQFTQPGAPPLITALYKPRDYCVPDCYSAERVRDMVRNAFLGIEGISIKEYDERRWQFCVEYGLEPIASVKRREVGHKLVQMRERNVELAVEKALDMFPHNFVSIEDDEIDRDWFNRRFWCRCKIRLSRFIHADGKESMVVSMIQDSTQRATCISIFQAIKREFNDRNNNWENRKAFVHWTEGTAEGKVSREDEHIQRYLFDHYVGREICSFMPCT